MDYFFAAAIGLPGKSLQLQKVQKRFTEISINNICITLHCKTS